MRDRHPVVAVLDEIQVPHPVHVDRRDRLAAPLRQREPLPALPHPARWWAGTGGRSPACESTVPTMRVQPDRLQAAAYRSPRRPSAATTSSNGRMRLTSSGSRRSRWASRASTWRRRTRRKSFSTSARGKPVSAGIPGTSSDTAEQEVRTRSYVVRPGCRARSARGRFPDVEPAFQQCGLHPVMSLCRPLPDASPPRAAGAGVQPLAGVEEPVDVSRAERSHPQVLGGLIAASLHVLKLSP